MAIPLRGPRPEPMSRDRVHARGHEELGRDKCGTCCLQNDASRVHIEGDSRGKAPQLSLRQHDSVDPRTTSCIVGTVKIHLAGPGNDGA